MKLSSSAAALAIALGVASLSSAQENQESHGSSGAAPQPAPTYVAPPPVYGPGGYGAPYQPAPPPMGPARMKYNEGDPVPPGYRVESRARTGLVVGGSILFGIFYGITLLAASETHNSDGWWLYVPVLGPFGYASTVEEGVASGALKTLLWMDGFLQAGGAAMLIIGVVGKTELVRNDIAKISVAPLFGRANGLSIVGEF